MGLLVSVYSDFALFLTVYEKKTEACKRNYEKTMGSLGESAHSFLYPNML